MKKLDDIKKICQEAIDEYQNLIGEDEDDYGFEIEQGRAELAEEILEILNGKNE